MSNVLRYGLAQTLVRLRWLP